MVLYLFYFWVPVNTRKTVVFVNSVHLGVFLFASLKDCQNTAKVLASFFLWETSSFVLHFSEILHSIFCIYEEIWKQNHFSILLILKQKARKKRTKIEMTPKKWNFKKRWFDYPFEIKDDFCIPQESSSFYSTEVLYCYSGIYIY